MSEVRPLHVAADVKAAYPLAKFITGYDFFLWLVMQQAAGATEVVFDLRNPKTGKWPLATVLERFESILWPGPALAGMSCSIGTGGAQLAPYYQTDFVALCRNGLKFRRLASVLPPGKERYTVTLRRTQRVPERNSNEPAWRAFAAEIGAYMIEDYDVRPIHLFERMALYAGAEMNFFTAHGPDVLCVLSEYPLMNFNCHKVTSVKHGVAFGEQGPWALPQHHSIYEPDDLPVIQRHFHAWLSHRVAS